MEIDSNEFTNLSKELGQSLIDRSDYKTDDDYNIAVNDFKNLFFEILNKHINNLLPSKKNKNKKKDPNAPQKSGYNLFQQTLSGKCKEENAKTSLKIYCDQWKSLSKDKKDEFILLVKGGKELGKKVDIKDCAHLINDIDTSQFNLIHQEFKNDYTNYLKINKYMKELNVLQKSFNPIKYWQNNIKNQGNKQELIDKWFSDNKQYVDKFNNSD